MLTALACMNTAMAAQQKNRPSSSSQHEAFYRCKDSAGQTHYGDSKPQACEGRDTDVISDNGTVLRVMEGDQTRAAREQREVVEAQAKQERDQRLQRDRMLIETYVSVEDIERLRDQRLELLDSQYRVTQQNMRNLRDRQARLENQIARFKPYTDKPSAPPLPDHLAEEMVNTVNGMRVYEETLAKTRAEQAAIKSSFDGDIKRFRELRGLK
jgi:hypothetical protein